MPSKRKLQILTSDYDDPTASWGKNVRTDKRYGSKTTNNNKLTTTGGIQRFQQKKSRVTSSAMTITAKTMAEANNINNGNTKQQQERRPRSSSGSSKRKNSNSNVSSDILTKVKKKDGDIDENRDISNNKNYRPHDRGEKKRKKKTILTPGGNITTSSTNSSALPSSSKEKRVSSSADRHRSNSTSSNSSSKKKKTTHTNTAAAVKSSDCTTSPVLVHRKQNVISSNSKSYSISIGNYNVDIDNNNQNGSSDDIGTMMMKQKVPPPITITNKGNNGYSNSSNSKNNNHRGATPFIHRKTIDTHNINDNNNNKVVGNINNTIKYSRGRGQAAIKSSHSFSTMNTNNSTNTNATTMATNGSGCATSYYCNGKRKTNTESSRRHHPSAITASKKKKKTSEAEAEDDKDQDHDDIPNDCNNEKRYRNDRGKFRKVVNGNYYDNAVEAKADNCEGYHLLGTAVYFDITENKNRLVLKEGITSIESVKRQAVTAEHIDLDATAKTTMNITTKLPGRSLVGRWSGFLVSATGKTTKKKQYEGGRIVTTTDDIDRMHLRHESVVYDESCLANRPLDKNEDDDRKKKSTTDIIQQHRQRDIVITMIRPLKKDRYKNVNGNSDNRVLASRTQRRIYETPGGSLQTTENLNRIGSIGFFSSSSTTSSSKDENSDHRRHRGLSPSSGTTIVSRIVGGKEKEIKVTTSISSFGGGAVHSNIFGEVTGMVHFCNLPIDSDYYLLIARDRNLPGNPIVAIDVIFDNNEQTSDSLLNDDDYRKTLIKGNGRSHHASHHHSTDFQKEDKEEFVVNDDEEHSRINTPHKRRPSFLRTSATLKKKSSSSKINIDTIMKEKKKKKNRKMEKHSFGEAMTSDSDEDRFDCVEEASVGRSISMDIMGMSPVLDKRQRTTTVNEDNRIDLASNKPKIMQGDFSLSSSSSFSNDDGHGNDQEEDEERSSKKPKKMLDFSSFSSSFSSSSNNEEEGASKKLRKIHGFSLSCSSSSSFSDDDENENDNDDGEEEDHRRCDYLEEQKPKFLLDRFNSVASNNIDRKRNNKMRPTSSSKKILFDKFTSDIPKSALIRNRTVCPKVSNNSVPKRTQKEVGSARNSKYNKGDCIMLSQRHKTDNRSQKKQKLDYGLMTSVASFPKHKSNNRSQDQSRRVTLDGTRKERSSSYNGRRQNKIRDDDDSSCWDNDFDDLSIESLAYATGSFIRYDDDDSDSDDDDDEVGNCAHFITESSDEENEISSLLTIENRVSNENEIRPIVEKEGEYINPHMNSQIADSRFSQNAPRTRRPSFRLDFWFAFVGLVLLFPWVRDVRENHLARVRERKKSLPPHVLFFPAFGQSKVYL